MARTGRPTHYDKKFHIKDFIEKSREGKNLTQIATSWDTNRQTLYVWAEKHKDFNDAIKTGRQYAESWYIDKGQEALTNRDKYVNIGLYVWLTKNLFNWSDKMEEKQEIQSSTEIKYITEYAPISK